MRKFIVLTAIITLMISTTAPVFAYDQTGRIGLGYRFGFHTVAKDPWGMKFMHGAEVKLGLHPYIMIGVTGTYGRTDGAKLNLSGALPMFEEYDKDVEKSLYMRNYILEVGPTFNLMPYSEEANVYLTAGIGMGGWTVKDADGNTIMVPDKNNEMFALDDQQLTLMLGGGFEYFLIEELSVGASLRYHVFTSVFSVFKEEAKEIDGSDALDLPGGLFEAGVNVTAYLGKCKDDDKDGVCNDDDQCPETPAGCVVDEVGCQVDTDGDGVCDGIDQCPDTPRGCKVDLNGCRLDSDMDGVCDGVDKCPGTPTGCKVDAVGCALDEDKDGVPDCRDKCPGTPECCKVDADGCELDSDNDGVCDGCDMCPGTPSEYEVDNSGCPVGYSIEKELVLPDVTFATNRAVLANKAKKALDKVADALKAMPHVRLEVHGHTDNTDGEKWNQELSEERAKSVVDYFVNLGLDKTRFVAKGFGMHKPKADNKTVEGRKANRRVELHRVN